MEGHNQFVIVVGAGLAGTLMAIYLAKRGHTVDIYESRPDMRLEEISAGRSINLALSDRGIRALKGAGVAEAVMKEAVPMPGRILHDKAGNTVFAPYGKDDSEYINSISRGGLNQILMTEAEKAGVSIHFNQRCVDVDFEAGLVTVEDFNTKERRQMQCNTIVGGDGANSAVRQAMESQVEGYESKVDWLEHGYKELTIPAAEGKNKFRISKEGLHIWPRGNYMLIALPNFDGSFTCTLFFPMRGENSFESLDTAEKVRAFFKEEFADAIPHLVNLEDEFLNNPVGKLGTLKCFPWHINYRAVLVGDSAHAVVPFYGQGMNASFEDCIVLDQCLEKHGVDWEAAYKEYELLRKINGDAIGDLAVENFYEMRDHVANPVFRRKRALEHQLENTYADYHSKYSLVTFHPEIPYSVAKEKGNKQDKFLMDICTKTEDISKLDIEKLYKELAAL